jgi:hypothetical protein
LFKTKGDIEVQREQKKLASNQRALNETKQMINVGSGVDGAITDEDLGFVRYSGTGNNSGVGKFSGTGTKVDAKLGISPADRDQMTLKASKVLENMWQISRDSNWAIQWTNLGFKMQSGSIPFDIADGLRASMGSYAGGKNKPVQISDINAAQPVVGNEVLTRNDLANIMLYKQAGVTTQMPGFERDEILENQAKIADIRRQVEDGKLVADDVGTKGDFGYIAGATTRIANLTAKNVSLGAKPQSFQSYQPEVAAVIAKGDSAIVSGVSESTEVLKKVVEESKHTNKLLEEGKGTVVIGGSDNSTQTKVVNESTQVISGANNIELTQQKLFNLAGA